MTDIRYYCAAPDALRADIRQIFSEAKRDRLASTYLVDRLVEMEERSWPEFRHGKPITARQIASLLRPFGIVPGTKRDGAETFKGYELSNFSSAFARYLADLSVTRSQPAVQSHFLQNHPVLGRTPENALEPDGHDAAGIAQGKMNTRWRGASMTKVSLTVLGFKNVQVRSARLLAALDPVALTASQF
jgi:hypothetical protein